MKYNLPEGWQLVKLGDLCKEVYRYPSYYGIKYIENGVPEVRGELIENSGSISLDKSKWRYISNETSNKFPKTILQAEDLVISVRGTIGKIGLVPKDLTGANITANLIRISPKRSSVLAIYLWKFLKSPNFQTALQSISSSTTIKTLKAPDLKNLNIPLPALPIQSKIAQILDKTDKLRQKRWQANAKINELLQSVFLDIFGDPLTNSRGWDLLPLHKLGNVITGATPPSKYENMFGGIIPFITPGDLESNKNYGRYVSTEGAEKTRVVRTGSAMVCCIGSTIGKVDKAKEKSAFNQQINAVEWHDKMTDEYGLMALRFLKKIIIAKGTSTTLPILKKSEFEKIKIPAPSIHLQKRYSHIFKTIEAQKVKNLETTQELDKLFNSILQRAFKGELKFNDNAFR